MGQGGCDDNSVVERLGIIKFTVEIEAKMVMTIDGVAR